MGHKKLNIKGPKLAVILILIGIIGLVYSYAIYTSYPKPPKGALTSKNAPSSIKPSQNAIASYTVPANDPKYIIIPALNITNTRIVKLGLTSGGQIASPDNIYDTGWYQNSALPGQKGAMFIYGHVSSWTANGIFYNLNKLSSGNKVLIVTGNNKVYTYQVVTSKIYPYNNVNMQEVLSPIDPKVAGLNLMTCTGQVIKNTSEFNQRLVVFTKLIT